MRIRILSAIVGLVIALTSVSWAAIYKRGAFSNLTVLSSAANAVTINSGTLYILNGHITVLGTGSSMTGLNDQDLIAVTNITSTGVATFTNATVSGTILGSSNGATTSSPVITYNANGTKSPSTIRAIQGSFVGNGGTVTVSFSQPIFVYVILLTNETLGTGASIAPTTTSPSGFTLASSASGQTYTYFAVGN